MSGWERPQGITGRLVPADANVLFDRLVRLTADRIGVADDDYRRDLGRIAVYWGWPDTDITRSRVAAAVEKAAAEMVEHREQQQVAS